MPWKDGYSKDPKDMTVVINLWDNFIEAYKDDFDKGMELLNQGFQEAFGLVTITIKSNVEDHKRKENVQYDFTMECFKCLGKPFKIGWKLNSEESKKMWPNYGFRAVDVLVHEMDVKTGTSTNKKSIITFMSSFQEESIYVLEKLLYGKI